MTTSAYCKHCKTNTINLYKKWSYCDDCGSKKQRLENRMWTGIVLTLITLSIFTSSSIQLLLHNEQPALTLYWGILVIGVTSYTGYMKRKVNRF